MVFKKETVMEYQDSCQITGYPVEIANRQTECGRESLQCPNSLQEILKRCKCQGPPNRSERIRVWL
jgi:hypothetical protein